MADHAHPGSNEFEAVARQYWNLWGDALRQWGTPAPAPSPWPAGMDWWSQWMPRPVSPMEEAMNRFRHQSNDWMAQIQQLAARFAGQDHAASDVAQAWRQMLGLDSGQGAWRDFLGGLQGGGIGGFDGWFQQLRPWLDNLQRDSDRWLHLPTFGPAREHQERWQQLIQAQQDYQRVFADYEQQMLHVMQLALARFETLLAARNEPGQQVTSARALFDLWIDAAEQAYAEVALSPEFGAVYGALTNAQMKLRLAVIKEIEQVCQQLGMPTRTEVDAAHRKIAELERRLRQAERRAGHAVARGNAQSTEPHAAAAPASASEPASVTVVRKPAAKPAASPAARKPAKRAVAKTTAAARKLAPAKKTVVRKAAAADKPVAVPVPPPVKSSAVKTSTDKASPAKPATSKSAAGKTTVSKAIPIKSVAAKSTAKPAAAKPAKPAAAKSAPVVSMKDWVARYAADEKNGKQGKRK